MSKMDEIFARAHVMAKEIDKKRLGEARDSATSDNAETSTAGRMFERAHEIARQVDSARGVIVAREPYNNVQRTVTATPAIVGVNPLSLGLGPISDEYAANVLINGLPRASARPNVPNLSEAVKDKPSIEQAAVDALARVTDLKNKAQAAKNASKSNRLNEDSRARLAAEAEDYQRQAAELEQRLASINVKKANVGQLVGDSVMRGINAFDKGLTSTADWLIGSPLKALGWENNPISALNRQITAEGEYYAQRSAENTRYDRAAQFAGEIVTGTVAAIPQAALALVTAGTSLGAQGTTAGLEAAAAGANASGLASTISSAIRDMANDPQYWLSFLQVAGQGYEDAKADGQSDLKASAYAMTNGLLNALVEVGGGGIQDLPENLRLGGGDALKEWISSAIDEGKEEVVQGVIERGLQNLIYGANNPLFSTEDEQAIFNPKTGAKEFGMGAAVGGILGGGQAAVQAAANAVGRAQVPPSAAEPRQAVQPGMDTSAAQGGVPRVSEGETGDPLVNAIRQMGQQQTQAANDPLIADIRRMGRENAASAAGAAGKADAREVVAKLQASIPALQSEPISATLNGAEFSKVGGKLTDQVGVFFQRLGNSVFRSGLGNVILDKRGVKSDIAHGIGRAKVITFAAVPDVIARGRQIDYQQNWKNRGYDTYVFAAPVNLAGQKTYVAAVVRSGIDNRFYLHEVVDENGNLIYKIDAPAAIKTGVTAQDGVTGATEASNNTTIPQGAESVKNGELPRGTGAAEAGFSTILRGEQVMTQNKAITENPLLSNVEQLQFAPGTHERVTSKMSEERATKLFYNDAEGNVVDLDETINGLLEKEMWTGSEQDAAQVALGMLLQEARQTGDYSKAETLVRAIERMGTEVGRSLQARQKWTQFLKSMTPEGRLFLIDQSIKAFQKNKGIRDEIKINDELKTRFLNAESEEVRDAVINAMQKDVAAQLPSTAREKWNTLRYVNMLGNFKTQIRNFSGNVVMQGITRAKDAVATGIEAIASKASGGKIERTKAFTPRKELIAAAKADFKTVKDIAMGESRYSINEGKNDATSFMKGVQEQKTVFKFGDNPLTRAIGIENRKGLVVYRFLEAYRNATDFMMNNGYFGDEAFTRSSYAHALAGYLTAHNVSAEQFTSADWQSRNADFVDKARAYAIKEAQEATFRDTNAVSKWVSQIARKDSTPRVVRLLAEGLAPFRKTPANVAVRAEEYSPLGLINTAVMAAQKAAGNADITGADIINQLSKSLTGSMIFGLGMFLKSRGWIRGKEDDDDQEYFDKLTGHQDYALELPGGFSYTLDWLSPAAMPLFMGVEMMDAIQEGGLSAGDLFSVLGAGVEAFWSPMLEMSMLSGINDTLDRISYSDNKWGRLAVQLGLSYLTQGLSNTLLGQIERISEPNRMSTFTNKDKEAGVIPPWLQREIGRLSAKTPGWDYRQREYTNAWGETQSNGDIGIRAVINLLSPGYVSHVAMNETERELQRIANQTGDTSVFPDPAQKSFTINGETIYMTMEEYDAYAKALGEYRRVLYTDILLAPIYQKLSDEDKAAAISKMEGYAGYKGKKEATDNYNGSTEMQAFAKADAAGIGPVEFFTYKHDTHGLTADKDENGNSIAGSKKAKVVAVINAMNLTPEEKDYLYLTVEGFAESGLADTPWHK